MSAAHAATALIPAWRTVRVVSQRTWRRLRRRLADQRGQTMLEWTLLLVVIALPSYVFVRTGVEILIAHYEMVTTLNGLPFP